MRAFIITNPFIRVNPLTGNAESHVKGEYVTHPDRVRDLEGSEHANHFTQTELSDDHPHDARNTAPEADEDQDHEESEN